MSRKKRDAIATQVADLLRGAESQHARALFACRVNRPDSAERAELRRDALVRQALELDPVRRAPAWSSPRLQEFPPILTSVGRHA